MMTLDIRNFSEVQRQLQNLAEKQIPYALMIAVNNTAFATQLASKQRISKAFDRPTSLIQTATRVSKATKESLTAMVYVEPRRAVILKTHEFGGERGQKSFERKLGLSMPWRAVPTKTMPRNQYGNPDPAINRRIIAAKGGKARGIYFIMPNTRSKQSPGIYQLVSKTKINKLYHFVNRVQYEPVLLWGETVEEEARRLLPIEADKAIRRALATAR